MFFNILFLYASLYSHSALTSTLKEQYETNMDSPPSFGHHDDCSRAHGTWANYAITAQRLHTRVEFTRPTR
jgi:hypothetical protein